MAFCPKCGTTIPEGSTEKFCGTCGQPLEGNDVPETTDETSTNTDETSTNADETSTNADEILEKGKEVAGEALEKGKELVGNVAEAAKNIDVNDVVEKVKSGDKKTIGILAGVAVVVVVLLIGSLFGGGGYMDPVNDMIKAINKKEINYLTLTNIPKGDKLGKLSKNTTQILIDSDAEYWSDTTYAEYYEDYNDDLEDSYEEIDDEYDSWKVSFEKKSAEKMDEDDLEDIADQIEESYEDFEDYIDDYKDILDDDDDLEDFADNYDITEDEAKKYINALIKYYEFFVDMDIQEAYEVKGKFIIKAEDDEFKSNTVKLYLVKVNGSWIYCGTDDSIYFEDDEDGIFSLVDNLLEMSGLYY